MLVETAWLRKAGLRFELGLSSHVACPDGLDLLCQCNKLFYFVTMYDFPLEKSVM